MTEKQLTALATVILTPLNNGKYPDLKQIIAKTGHFNYRVFSPEKFFHQNGANIMRYLIIMNFRITEQDFYTMMNQLIEKIISIADNYENQEQK